MELTPPFSAVELTDLRIGQLSYLITPVSLRLIQQEQRNARERAELQTRQRLQQLLGPMSQYLLDRCKPNRRETRLTMLDISWKPHQSLVMTFRNAGETSVDKISIELVLYAFDTLSTPLPVAN
jgi:hypothetical protein